MLAILVGTLIHQRIDEHKRSVIGEHTREDHEEDASRIEGCFSILLPWFQRFIFIIFIAKGRGKINLWLKAAIDSSSRANQFELGSEPDSVS